MSYADLWSEVLGHVPNLDALLAQRLVNRAYKDIREARQWSWLRGFGALLAPQVINTGTVTVTQYSNTIALDAAANPALNNLQHPLITQRQIRVSSGPMYNISGYDNGAATVTLDRIYMENSATAVPYQVYRCYYQPADQNGDLATDFLLYRAVLNPVEGFAIVGKNLRLTRGELDARDPTRGAQDIAYTMASFTVDANGVPFYEMWPHPTSNRAYLGLYIKRGLDLSPTVNPPITISSDMIVEHALEYAFDWAIANAGRFPNLKGVNWALLKAEQKRKYDRMLIDAKRNDDNIMLDNWIPQLRDYLQYPPIDSAFFQSHDVSGWFGGL